MLREVSPYVSVISCGDFSQGGHLCAFTHGLDIMSLMNRAGYSVATLGNHEFDYGPNHAKRLAELFDGDVVLCNFEDLRTNEFVYAPYSLQQFGDVTIGFVGVLNPSTETTDAPQTYFDADGNLIYTFHHSDIYTLVQQSIDQAYEAGADYVIILSHLGENMGLPINSLDLISQTQGAIAVLDGHAHHYNEGEWLINAEGDSVLFLTTGARFENIGELRIQPDSRLSHKMHVTKQLNEVDPAIVACIDSLENAVSTTPPFGFCDFDLLGFDAYGVYDRNCETNLGDLCADATRMTMGVDIAWVNSGGIRVSIRQGSFGIREVIDMYPFDNTMCISSVKGSVLRNALEYCMSFYPNDSGSFPQISGFRFTFDPQTPSAAIIDERGMLVGIKEGPQRIREIWVLNKQGEYEPLDPDRSYTMAGASFLLRNGGCGGIFNDTQLLFDSGTMDAQNFEDFITYHLNGRIPEHYRNTQQRIIAIE